MSAANKSGNDPAATHRAVTYLRALSVDPARFCPSEPVTRAQMASFLHRALQFNATVTWLSAGDSYSSGVGTDPHAQGSCRRSPQAAGPAAAELLRR